MNPTSEEAALLRTLWKADDAEAEVNRSRARTQALIDENRRLLAERDRLLRELAITAALIEENP